MTGDGANATKRVVLVGHCTPDRFMLQAAIGGMVPGVAVESINSDAGMEAAGAGVMLVNRVLDGDFASTDGVAMIAHLAAAGAKAMLISNYEDAQERAVALGAVPGFGKSDMRSERAEQNLRAALGLGEG